MTVINPKIKMIERNVSGANELHERYYSEAKKEELNSLTSTISLGMFGETIYNGIDCLF